MGNFFGATSIIMLINVYKILSPAVTLAICTGGAFVLNQLGLLLVFRKPVSGTGWLGIALITAEIMIFAFGGNTQQ